jgi:quercetin dioxygenase-like cupin family protein
MNMKLRRLSQEPGEDVAEEGYAGVNSVWVVPERADIAAFSSRMFLMAPSGHTSMHAHDREHVALVIRGICRIECSREVKVAEAGDVMTIPPNAAHRFSNVGTDPLALLIMNFYPDPRKIVKADSSRTSGESN